MAGDSEMRDDELRTNDAVKYVGCFNSATLLNWVNMGKISRRKNPHSNDYFYKIAELDAIKASGYALRPTRRHRTAEAPPKPRKIGKPKNGAIVASEIDKINQQLQRNANGPAVDIARRFAEQLRRLAPDAVACRFDFEKQTFEVERRRVDLIHIGGEE